MAEKDIPGANRAKKKQRGLRLVLQLLLSLAVLGCAVALASYYISTPPKAKPKKRSPKPPLVEVSEITFSSPIYSVQGMGTVVGAQEVNISSRVGGEIVEISPELEPGGYFSSGDLLLRIDPIDYELNILELSSEVAKARSDLSLEMGNQRIARKEFEILGEQVTDTEENLMLRKPQLGIARANLDGQEARLKKARLDLSRTKVTAPFNAVVIERMVDLGSMISQSTSLARLVGTDIFWVKLTVPVEQLQWLRIPDDSNHEGSEAQIYLQQKEESGLFRQGKIVRLGAGLEQAGRMAIVYVQVEDPLCLLPENQHKPRLLLDSFVRVEIAGKEFTSIAAIPRDQLRTGDTVWLLDRQNTLEIRPIKIAAKTRDQVFIESGLEQGEKIITSSLSNPVSGTKLRLFTELETQDLTTASPEPQRGQQ